ncbi:MAG: exo-alpha-sialidase [Ignavibacteria bacterium]|nr:exo-alpha-sialidase [Ignavibacteria bacterium]
MKKLILFILIAAVSHAQWQEEVKLSNGSASTAPNSRSISVSVSLVHVVYSQGYFVDGKIYYTRSTDGGKTWQNEPQLLAEDNSLYNPSVSVSGGYVHVIWQSDNGKVFYKRSTDFGITWGETVRLINNTGAAYLPAISASGQVVNIVWNQSNEVYYIRSSDNGATWNSQVRFTNHPGFSYAPSIYSRDSYVHLTWSDEIDNNEEIFYKRSTDKGMNWDETRRLSDGASYSQWPSVSGSGSEVYVVWSDNRDSQPEIYFKRSTDNGITWGADVRLSNKYSNSSFPTLTVYKSILHVGWSDDRTGNLEIFYKRSSDYGNSWSQDVRLTYSHYWCEFPAFAVSGKTLHMIWDDKRDGDNVYYKRNPTGNMADGLAVVNPLIPVSFLLYQNYPNPFNPQTKIRFAVPVGQSVRLVIYNTMGQEVAEIVKEYLGAGTYEASFDAVNLTNGVYFYKLITADFTATKKMVLIK